MKEQVDKERAQELEAYVKQGPQFMQALTMRKGKKR